MLELSTKVRLHNAVPRALEDERLVLFCGAGISRYTGLPDFRTLTAELFAGCGVPLAQAPRRSASFCETLTLEPGTPWDLAFWEGKYDRALALLEREVPREVVRRKLVDRLSRPPPADSADCALHRDLMALAALRGGGYRLVTTNFDDRFARATADGLLNTWEAPRIAVPRPAAWRSLTFLHGRILRDGDRGAEDLIVTSADFGRAYLQDGWAARFVVELFREFTVLFVGYSINDPVMTYLVDAIAMDRASGRPFRQPYALVGRDEGVPVETIQAQWRSKNVEPILYPSADRHKALHQSIAEWAALHQGGFESRLARACDILRSACGPSAEADRGDVESLVWALSKPDGSVARAIADGQGHGDPGAELRIAWLRPLLACSDRLASRTGTDADGRDSPTGAFLIDGRWLGDPLAPPALPDGPGQHIRRSPLFGSDPWVAPHPVASHLARWVASRLHEPELARIVGDRRGEIGAVLRDAIERALNGQHLRLAGDLDKFWCIVLRAQDDEASDRASQHWSTDSVRRVNARGLDADARSRLLRVFEPRIAISPTWVTPDLLREGTAGDPQAVGPDDTGCRLRALAEVRLQQGNRRFDHQSTSNWLRGPDQAPLLADLAADLGECLVRVLRCAEWIEDTGPLALHASWIPSFGTGASDDGASPTWGPLLYLCRDGSAALSARDPEAGARLLDRWAHYGREPWGALFVRLVLNAAGTDPRTTGRALGLLMANANDVLWDGTFAGELRPFLGTLAGRVSRKSVLSLERLWRTGPPPDHWSRRPVGEPGSEHPYCDVLVDERLAWLVEGGAKLSAAGLRRGQRQLDAWRAAAEGGPSAPTARRSFEWLAPPDPDALVALAPVEAANTIEPLDDWEASKAMDAYARHEPLQAMEAFDLLGQRRPERSSYLLENLAAGAAASADPDRFILAGSRLVDYLHLADGGRYDHWGYCAWLQAAARELAVDQEGAAAYWTLWDRIWAAAIAIHGAGPSADMDDLTVALNAPGGKLCLALLDRLWKRAPAEDAGLPSDLQPRFDALVGGNTRAQRHARAMLVSRLVWLYRVCPDWCDRHLLGRLADFESPASEAVTLWLAFLWPAAGSTKLWPALKPCLMAALRHTDRFKPDDRRRLMGRIASSWLRPGLFDAGDGAALCDLFGQFGAEALAAIAWMWSDALRVQGEAAATLWREQIAPRVANYWPLRESARSTDLNERLGAMLLRTREAFQDALRLLTDPSERPVLGPARDLLLVLDVLVGTGGENLGSVDIRRARSTPRQWR